MPETDGSFLARTRTHRWGGGALLALFLLLCLQPAHAQGGGFENVYVEPGRPAMEVYVLGDVGRPGKWRVTRGISLFDVLAVAVPAGAGALGGEAEVTIELYRVRGNMRELVFEDDLASLISSADATMPLQAGDVLRVQAVVNRKIPLREILQITTSIASLVLLIVSLASSN